MDFSLISNSEKKKSAETALRNVEDDLYRLIHQLGEDPETFNPSTFVFDSSSSAEEDRDFAIKRDISANLTKLTTLKAKIQQLS
jgi:hypothetical protein